MTTSVILTKDYLISWLQVYTNYYSKYYIKQYVMSELIYNYLDQHLARLEKEQSLQLVDFIYNICNPCFSLYVKDKIKDLDSQSLAKIVIVLYCSCSANYQNYINDFIVKDNNTDQIIIQNVFINHLQQLLLPELRRIVAEISYCETNDFHYDELNGWYKIYTDSQLLVLMQKVQEIIKT